ncbi:MAG: ribonuclease R, partial [Clostridia bacterium]
VLAIIKDYEFDIAFPKKVMAEAEAVPDEISSSDLENRLDLRDRLIITIDGDDSKDLDDAISLEKTDKGYRLGVHIADVSNYVRPKSPLDKEAISRGTSVYLVDRVIPMLPPRLSNGICSLNEGVDRLTMSVIMDMDEDGQVIKSEFYKSVIKSTHRMTYNNVWKLLMGGDVELEKKYADVLPMLKDMHALSLKLKRNAERRGYVELELPEAKAILDENGRAVGIELRKVNEATELIEQFMVSANMEVAKFLWERKCPAVYRVHDLPDENKMKMLRRFVSGIGINPNLSLGEIVDAAADMPEKNIVSAMALRSMAKAKYSPKNSGHYGLGAEYYCHFTSPIRRYPDLVCHRALKAIIENDAAAVRLIGRMNSEAAQQSSEREVAAERCERDVLDMKKAEYMEQFVGKDFHGIITSVANFGFFVSLPDTVEGLVSVTSLDDDYYVFDDNALLLRGERHRREYRLGDEVEVTLVSANKHNRKIEFIVKGQQHARKPKAKEEKPDGGKQRRKNSGAKQKRVPRVFHRRKNRSRH